MADATQLWGKVQINNSWSQHGPDMYFTDADINGRTAFFRYGSFYKNLFNDLSKRSNPQEEINVLIAAGSVGCEAYSAAIIALEEMGEDAKHIKISTVDMSGDATAIVEAGLYPKESIGYIPDNLKKYFKDTDNSDFVEVVSKIKSAVTALPASKIQDLPTDKKYDVVVAFNVLQHIPWTERDFMSDRKALQLRKDERAQGESAKDFFTSPNLQILDPVIQKLAALTKDYLCLNALDDTPFLQPSKAYTGNIFADMGFKHLMRSNWRKASIDVLEHPVNRSRITRRMSDIYVLRR